MSHFSAVAIGSSTGGPPALRKIFSDLSKAMPPAPFFVTQHMPPFFTKKLASEISVDCGVDCIEAEDGMEVSPQKIYIAPGDFHMLAHSEQGRVFIKLNQDEKENYCRPAVDPMLRSLNKVYGSGLLVVILTGMGHDGLQGAKQVAGRGGTVIAQDEASSVVWGMPGAVVKARICMAVLPLDEIGGWIATNAG